MTLIAAFKCINGYVICADSQDTVGGRRAPVVKVNPFTAGNFQIAAGGSGENGELIDSFVRCLEENLSESSIRTLSELAPFIRRELLDFRREEAAYYSRKDLQMQFIVAARSIDPPNVQVWRTAAARLIPVNTYALVGWDEELYRHIAKRLHSPTMSFGQGIFIVLYLFSIAEKTSNYIIRPFSVVFANEDSIDLRKEEDVDRWTREMDSFSKTNEIGRAHV
jgi:hypothetical protein